MQLLTRNVQLRKKGKSSFKTFINYMSYKQSRKPRGGVENKRDKDRQVHLAAGGGRGAPAGAPRSLHGRSAPPRASTDTGTDTGTAGDPDCSRPCGNSTASTTGNSTFSTITML